MNASSITQIQRRLGPLLTPLGAAYALTMRGRAALHGSGLLDHFKPDAPAVSVGNIAWGGSGKTPVCRWLLDWAFAHGWRTVLLTRGYGARPPSLPFEVRLNSPADFAGDEPLYLKRGRPEATVLVDPKRTRSGAFARERIKPDLYIYDDAFQHLPARRHVNLVLLRPADLTTQWNRVLPAGSWREGVSALERASAFLIKAEPERAEALREAACARLARFGKPVFSFHLAARGLTRLDGAPLSPAATSSAPQPASVSQSVSVPTPPPKPLPKPLPDGPYVLISGVADPDGVAATAERLLGRPPVLRLDFPDHHPFSAADAAAIAQEAERLGAAVVCTPKDAVKLRGISEAASFLVFDLDLAFGPVLLPPSMDGADFPTWLESAVAEAKRALGLD